MSFIKTQDGEQLFYRDQGTGAPVILIHGWPLNADMWEYQIPALVRSGHRVITYDRRGFGRSTQPGKGYNYDVFASDLKDIINQLELQQVALVGFSMGGGEIARYLSTYGGEKVSKTVLISSVVPYMLKDDSNPDGVDELVFEKMIYGLKEDRPHFLAGFNKDFYGVGLITSPVSHEILQWTASMAYQASPIATQDCVNAFGRTDFRKDLRAFTMPTLVVHGTSDETVPINPTGEAAALQIPGAVFKKYEGAPHGLFVTHKDELTTDLCEFLTPSAFVQPQVPVDGYPIETPLSSLGSGPVIPRFS